MLKSILTICLLLFVIALVSCEQSSSSAQVADNNNGRQQQQQVANNRSNSYCPNGGGCQCNCNCGRRDGGGNWDGDKWQHYCPPCPYPPGPYPPGPGIDNCFELIRAASRLSTGQVLGLLLQTLLSNLVSPILQVVLAGNNTVEGAVTPLTNILCYVVGLLLLTLRSLGLLGLLGMNGLLDNILGGGLLGGGSAAGGGGGVVGDDWIKRIERFYVFYDDLGVNILFVTKDDDRVYGLGANYWGSLGLGHNLWVSEPQEIIDLRHKKIINFINGDEFIICVSSDNCVYSCGYNRDGQLGQGYEDFEYRKPMIIQINENNDLIIDLSCGSNHTLVVTQNNNEVYGWGSNDFGQIGSRDTTCDGQVFSWGQNRSNQLGLNSNDLIIFRPKLISNLSGITSIQSGAGISYFSSDHKNEVYFCGEYYNENNEINIQAIHKLLGSCKQFLNIQSISSNKWNERIYLYEFLEIDDLNTDYFTLNNVFYKEIDKVTKIKTQYLVYIFGFWAFNNCIYISMEYCLMNLKEAIKLKTQVFGRQSSDEPMDCMEYYITCELLLEVLECVRYLHELQPPVIHRDLKPDNILIADDIINGRFVKLCDLGLITVHEKVSQSHTSGVGSPKYMAPEVISGRKYDTKADVYSISVIIEELFDTDVNDSRDKYTKHEWSNKYCKLLDIIKHTMQPVYNERPTCAQIIEQYNEWAIDSKVVTNDVNYEQKLLEIKHKERELRSDDLDCEPNSRDMYTKHEWSNKYCKLLDIIKHTMQPVYNERPTCAQIIEQYNEWAIDSKVLTNDSNFHEKLQQLIENERKLRSEDMDSEPEFWEIFYKIIITRLFSIVNR
ncbi:uncharacterized protein LOC128959358 [Oppia nitens]|uniref:uncharacterized protein LOC128959358 n=1 Tax=Oppia nitens TaxID=1686743 RepID=UPI0023DB97DD|nr:uncharacterized protein LOC128959358 [Oppia nitens]